MAVVLLWFPQDSESTSVFKEYIENLSEDERTLFQDEFNTYDKDAKGFITKKVELRQNSRAKTPTLWNDPAS